MPSLLPLPSKISLSASADTEFVLLAFSFRYKREQDAAFVATCSLHSLLNASLLSDSGPPLLDFEVGSISLLAILYTVVFKFNA